jgi:Methyltransferase domain
VSFSQSVNNVWHRIAAVFRKRRRKKLLALFPSDLFPALIDLGGLIQEWEDDPRRVTVVNLMPQENSHCDVIVGDGRHTDFPDQAFDLAYSNSTIEHVGCWEDQKALAAEMCRIGKAVYCQTPNKWFPIEVHYLTFFLHWQPRLLRNHFIARFLTGWGWLVRPDRAEVERYGNSVNLLSTSGMQQLFPGCRIEKEKFLWVTKSLIAIRQAMPQGSIVDPDAIERTSRS